MFPCKLRPNLLVRFSYRFDGSAFCRLADSTGQRIRLVGLEGPWCESSSDKGGAIPVCRPKKHIRLHLLRLEKQKTKTFMAVTTEPDTSSSSLALWKAARSRSDLAPHQADTASFFAADYIPQWLTEAFGYNTPTSETPSKYRLTHHRN